MIGLDVKVYTDQITNKLQNGVQNSTLKLATRVLEDSNRYIPKQMGILEGSSLTHSDLPNGKLVWATPYARRLYYNPQYNFSKDVNPNAGGLWYERAKSQYLNEWQKIVAEEYT